MAAHSVTVDELPSHHHNSVLDDTLATDNVININAWYQATRWSKHWRLTSDNIRDCGSDIAHNNIQSSKAVFVWLRIV